jgi:hypothetical protein
VQFGSTASASRGWGGVGETRRASGPRFRRWDPKAWDPERRAGPPADSMLCGSMPTQSPVRSVGIEPPMSHHVSNLAHASDDKCLSLVACLAFERAAFDASCLSLGPSTHRVCAILTTSQLKTRPLSTGF